VKLRATGFCRGHLRLLSIVPENFARGVVFWRRRSFDCQQSHGIRLAAFTIVPVSNERLPKSAASEGP
jgi:hypothetical protein